MNIKENFETWALTQGYSLVEINSNYQVTNTITAWNAWLAATVQPSKQWIDVNKRMPEQGQKVLIYRPFAHEKPHDDPNFKIALYCGEGLWINSHFEHLITHWMPITSPPEELPFL